MNYTYEHGNTPERDPDDFWNRFNVSDISPTEEDMAELDRREQSRKEASERIGADLRRFVRLVNESFAVAVRAEFSPGANCRKVVGRDGVERDRQKIFALIGLGPVDAMKLPSDDEAARIGEILAHDVRRENPEVAAFAYVGPAPIGLLGERFGAPGIRLVATVEGLHAEARLGMYFAPIAIKEKP